MPQQDALSPVPEDSESVVVCLSFEASRHFASCMASPILTLPASPSVFDQGLQSPNSWTARSFTTLQPSDSPSQAAFPKHSHASLLLAARTDNAHITRPPPMTPIVTRPSSQPPFFGRNLYFILFTTLLHISIIVLTIMLVLIITAATSNPHKHINPSCYVGVMISAVAGLASVIIIYVKYKERNKYLATKALRPPTSPSHNIELGHLPPPMTTSRGIVSNWEDLQSRHPLRSMMVSRNLPSASARIAGSNNHPRVLAGLNVPPAQPYEQQQHQQHDSTSTAAALQRFLDHELQRQEAVKRRISIWLGSLNPDLRVLNLRPSSHRPSSPPVQLLLPPDYPPPPIPEPILRARPTEPPKPRTSRDPVRLAELTKEIEAYLGFPAPPLVGERDPYADWGVKDEEAVLSHEVGLKQLERMEKFDREVVSEDTEEEKKEIDYSNLPPAIPRIGAHGRDPMLSDPITVLHVGPIKEGLAQQGSPLRNEGLKKEVQMGLRGGEGCGGSFGEVSREGRDSFAERWIRRVVRGVEVERKVGSAVGVAKKGKKGWRWWKLW
ncbi:MAG: hypothetical protein Q9213_003705 [Squamulea squamosa]